MPRAVPSDLDRPLRIAYLVYRGNPHCGGQGVYTRALAKELLEKDPEVESAWAAEGDRE